MNYAVAESIFDCLANLRGVYALIIPQLAQTCKIANLIHLTQMIPKTITNKNGTITTLVYNGRILHGIREKIQMFIGAKSIIQYKYHFGAKHVNFTIDEFSTYVYAFGKSPVIGISRGNVDCIGCLASFKGRDDLLEISRQITWKHVSYVGFSVDSKFVATGYDIDQVKIHHDITGLEDRIAQIRRVLPGRISY